MGSNDFYMFLFRRVVDLYWRFFKSPEAYARHIGVTIGENCLIATRQWPSEPYLVKIGNNVQITSNVVIHTHREEMLLDVSSLILIVLERLLSKIGVISVPVLLFFLELQSEKDHLLQLARWLRNLYSHTLWWEEIQLVSFAQ